MVQGRTIGQIGIAKREHHDVLALIPKEVFFFLLLIFNFTCREIGKEAQKLRKSASAKSKDHLAAHLMKVLANVWSGGYKNSKFPEVDGLF